MSDERAKVTVTLDVKMTIEVTDTGYLGTQAAVQKHIDKAREDAQNWRYLVQQGALDPKPVRARVEVLAVSIIPEGQS